MERKQSWLGNIKQSSQGGDCDQSAGVLFNSDSTLSILCWPTRIVPLRGLSMSAISAITIEIINGGTIMDSRNLIRRLYPTVRQASSEMSISIIQIDGGMRFSRLASCFSLKSMVSFNDETNAVVIGSDFAALLPQPAAIGLSRPKANPFEICSGEGIPER